MLIPARVSACRLPRPSRRTVVAHANLEVVIRLPSGQKWHFIKEDIKIGTGHACDLKLESSKVAEHHATLHVRGKQLFCQAVVGKEDGIWGESHTWLEGQQLRPGVSYLLGSGAKLAVGEPRPCMTLEFPEFDAKNPLVEIMAENFAARTDGPARKQVGGTARK